MCCSAWPASFSRTITGTWEVLVDGKVNHVLWYQNRVGDGANTQSAISGADANNEGNCLVIPLLGTWESISLLDTLKTPKLLENVSRALKPPPMRGAIQDRDMSMIFGATGEIRFLQFDIYDIVLAQRAQDIPAVLPQIQEAKRPKVNADVFQTLDRWYCCPVAVCCFNSADSGTAKPLGFAFEPLYPDKLVVYSLDGHDGLPPNPTAKVTLDHDIFVGSYLMKADQYAQVTYDDFIFPSLKKYLLEDVLGTQCFGEMENGDFIFSTAAVRAGHFEGLRWLPPFAPHDLPRLGHKLTREESYVTSNRPRRRL